MVVRECAIVIVIDVGENPEKPRGRLAFSNEPCDRNFIEGHRTRPLDQKPAVLHFPKRHRPLRSPFDRIVDDHCLQTVDPELAVNGHQFRFRERQRAGAFAGLIIVADGCFEFGTVLEEGEDLIDRARGEKSPGCG